MQKKVTRMEHEYQDLVIKTEFLKASKVKIKKDIEFYKSIIDKVVCFITYLGLHVRYSNGLIGKN